LGSLHSFEFETKNKEKLVLVFYLNLEKKKLTK